MTVNNSIVSICNLALTNIGKDNINALSEPQRRARAISSMTMCAIRCCKPIRGASRQDAITG